jgi:hypothetical protein
MTAAAEFIAQLQSERRGGNVSGETEQHLKHEFRKLGRNASDLILSAAVGSEISRLEREAATLRKLRETLFGAPQMITEALGSLATARPVSWRSGSLWRRLSQEVRIRGAGTLSNRGVQTLVLVVSPAKLSTVRQQDLPCPYGAADVASYRRVRLETSSKISYLLACRILGQCDVTHC